MQCTIVTQYLFPLPGQAMRCLNRRRCGPGATTLMWAMSERYRRGEGRSREIKMGSYGVRACRPTALFIRKNRVGHVVRAARHGGSVATASKPCLYPHLSEHGGRTSEARSTGLCPATRGLAPALWAGVARGARPPLYLQPASARVWPLATPNAHSTADARQGGLTDEKMKTIVSPDPPRPKRSGLGAASRREGG